MTKVTVNLPDIGEGVVEGEVIEWLKKVGDAVKQDEPVVVVMTDKATVELPAPQPGKLVKQYYQPGEMAQCEKPLYDLESAGKAPQRKMAIPAVRKMARDMGIDLEKVTGTGADGRVTADDLQKHVKKPSEEEVPFVGIRHQMALQMAKAHAEIPHFSYFEQVEATRLIQLKEHIQKEAGDEGVRMTFMPLFIRALSRALQQFPKVNSSYDSARHTLILHEHHNIGIAFTTEQGLIVPVLKEVEQLSLADTIRKYEALKQKVADNKLQPADMQGGTITMSNFGVFEGHGLFATPIIHPAEVAILALAKIQPQPMVKQGQLVVCDLLNLSWSFDHRVIDGALAAAFSHRFCSLIQNPAQIL